MIDKADIEIGKCYLIRYKVSARSNARVYKMNAHILDVNTTAYRTQIVTNHRPWNEGGSGLLYLDMIESITEIERGPHGR